MSSITALSKLFAPCLILLLAACAAQSPGPTPLAAKVSKAELLDGSIVGLEPDDVLEPTNILAINDDMRTFLDAHVPENAHSKHKVQLILAAILDDGLRLDYNLFRTHTAEEAFYSRDGNCMSFTNLFVALARATGVSASYQEVEVPPTWEARGDTWLYNKHLNAVVDLPGGRMMVDFALESYNDEYRRTQLGDDEAQARYHNNMGVHWMSEGDLPLAFKHFRRALEIAPDTGYFWTNLGTLYRRAGRPDAAEAAFLAALDVSRDPAAMSNLARLYRANGSEDLARWYEDKVQLFRRKNPYYLFHLSEEAYAAGDFERAAREARRAIRLHKGVHEFHHMLGLAHVQLGELEQAEQEFALAATLAADAKQRASYNRKLELLAKH